jgi:hypothetical protein
MTRISATRGPRKSLSYEQRKVALKAAKARHQKEKDDVNEVLNLIDQEAVHLGALHNKPAAYFLQQLHQGGRFARKKREPNIWNAAEHCMGLIEKEKESKHDSLLGKTHY